MKKLLKRIVLLIGTVCLCFLGVSFYGPSREAQAASYSVSTYAQLVDACSKRGSNTVTLTSDITLSGAVTIGSSCDITLNGNGKVIRPSNAANCFEIRSSGKLTVSNLTVDRSNSPNGNVFFVDKGGALVVNGGTYKASNGSAGVGSSVINAKGMATINGGTFSGSNQDFYAVTLAGAYPYVINDGTFTGSTSGVGVNLDTAGTQSLTINNGNFHNNANNGITVGNPTLSQAGTTTVTINNGNFYNNGANGISVCYKNQTCNIKRGNFYNNAVGILCHEAKVSFTGTASDAADLKVYNNKSHNVSVQQAGTFTGGNANMTNTGACVGKGSGIRVNNGTVTINSGLTISNCENGIVSYSSTDKVMVNGGLISGCATGINMDSSGTCTIILEVWCLHLGTRLP